MSPWDMHMPFGRGLLSVYALVCINMYLPTSRMPPNPIPDRSRPRGSPPPACHAIPYHAPTLLPPRQPGVPPPLTALTSQANESRHGANFHRQGERRCYSACSLVSQYTRCVSSPPGVCHAPRTGGANTISFAIVQPLHCHSPHGKVRLPSSRYLHSLA